MLRENPQARPNIYQALREACAMQGCEPPVKDVSWTNGWPYSRRLTYPPPRSNRASRRQIRIDATSLCPIRTPSLRRRSALSSRRSRLSSSQ
jgi:hypothetical protein